MRRPMTIRMDPDILDAARRRAAAQNRTVTNYIETSVLLDTGKAHGGLGDDEYQISAPADIRECTLVKEPGESEEDYRKRRDLFSRVLTRGGY